jgi:hypothetical protein
MAAPWFEKYVNKILISELVNNCIVIAGRALTSTHLSLPFSEIDVQFHASSGIILKVKLLKKGVLSILVD